MAQAHTTAATITDGDGDDQVVVAWLELQRNPGRGMRGPAWQIRLATPRLSGERAWRETYAEAQAHAATLAPLVRRLEAAERELDAAKDALYAAFSAQPAPAAQPVPVSRPDDDEPPF